MGLNIQRKDPGERFEAIVANVWKPFYLMPALRFFAHGFLCEIFRVNKYNKSLIVRFYPFIAYLRNVRKDFAGKSRLLNRACMLVFALNDASGSL